MMLCRVRKYVTHKGFGFLTSLDGTQEVFFHRWVFNSLGGPPPIEGEEVRVVVNPSSLPDGLPRADVVERVTLPSEKEGVIIKFDDDRGYGFVSSGGCNYYLHKSDFSTPDPVRVGQRVRFYATDESSSGRRPRSCHVQTLDT